VSRLLTRLLVVPLALSTIAFGCKDDSSGPDGGGGQGGEGGYGGSGSSVTTAQRTIGKNGGRLQTTNVSLFIPSGALTKDRTITVTELDAAAIAALPETTDGIKMSGIPAKFEPHGLTFSEPAEIILGYDEPTDEDEPLAVLKLDNDQDTSWEYVPGAKFESGSSSFEVDGFSIYCVFRDPNGVADEVYGPEGGGTGGATGSGGQTSTGGAGTGGGTGGSAGGTNPPGYNDTPEFHGFGDIDVGPGAEVTETDIETAPGPNCVAGTTGPNEEDVVTIFYNINQDVDGSPPEPLLISEPGLRLDLDFQNSRSIIVELRGQSASWCVAYTPEIPGSLYWDWGDFDSYYCDYQSSGAFDPATDEVVSVAVTVRSDGTDNSAFDFCLEEVSSGVPNGYMDGPTWSGGGFTDSNGQNVMTHDLAQVEFPNCIEGTTNADSLAFVELGYYLNQEVTGQSGPGVEVGGTGLALELTNDPARFIQVRLFSQTAAAYFCWNSPSAVGSGPLSIAWDQFEDCALTDPFVPSSAPLDYISVQVLSSTIADDPYQLCIESMTEDP